MKDIRKYQYKRIDTLEMQKYLSIYDYRLFTDTVMKLQEEGAISPVKGSKLNGKNPPLYNRYNIHQEKRDYSQYEDELKHRLNYRLNTDYYLKHIEQYLEDREYVIKLSNFLNKDSVLLDVQISENERSFQIWGREKYLKSEGGKGLLKNLGISMDKLNIYPTTEPLAYFSLHKNTPQKILILENKDTFYTIRQYLIKGGTGIFGQDITTVMYGRGKDIWRTFNDFSLCMEPYLLCKKNDILYLGDIDYEGILIYEELYKNFRESFPVKPFVKAYCYMIDKYIKNDIILPKSKEGQNKNIEDIFLNNFLEEYKVKIMDILLSGRYIPQEIINFGDLVKESRNEF